LSRVGNQREFAIRDALAKLTPPILLYTPIRVVRRRVSQRRVMIEQRRPALRPYVFVQVEAAEAFHRGFRSIWRIHPIKIDAELALVQPAAIAALQAIEAEGGFDDPNAYSVVFRAGEAVLVASGTFNSRGIVLADSRPRKKVKVGFARALTRLAEGEAAPARCAASGSSAPASWSKAHSIAVQSQLRGPCEPTHRAGTACKPSAARARAWRPCAIHNSSTPLRARAVGRRRIAIKARPPNSARRSSQWGCNGRKTTRQVAIFLNSIHPLIPPGAHHSASGAPRMVAPVSIGVHCQARNFSRNNARRPPSRLLIVAFVTVGKQLVELPLGVAKRPRRALEIVGDGGQLGEAVCADLERQAAQVGDRVGRVGDRAAIERDAGVAERQGQSRVRIAGAGHRDPSLIIASASAAVSSRLCSHCSAMKRL
jgi:hypothetical protein